MTKFVDIALINLTYLLNATLLLINQIKKNRNFFISFFYFLMLS